ncbi:MAG TPA: metal-dependent hydrolase [Verrucomicrobiae bacterium]|nr:metal-dependent hydrolase [Verrucomicrobiae bacterium]
MFIGHFAVGFGAKKFAPRTSFALLLAAPLLSDIFWPIFLLLGWEHARIVPGITKYSPLDLYDFPWSHSLLLCCVWATLFAGVYYAIARYRAGAVAIWIGVVSHWVLDWISHGPDMPLYPGSAKYGLGLWNSIWGTMTVEIAMYALGVGLYVSATRARDRIGTYAFWAFVLLNFGFYIADRFGPLPANMSEVAWPGVIASAVLLPWAWWFDRHRALRGAPLPST